MVYHGNAFSLDGHPTWQAKPVMGHTEVEGPIFHDACRSELVQAYEVMQEAQALAPACQVQGRAPLEEWLDVLGPFIGQLHLHDNGGKKDDHLALGRGRIDFRPLFAFLKAERPRPPVVTMEVHRYDDIWASLEFLERLWPWEKLT